MNHSSSVLHMITVVSADHFLGDYLSDKTLVELNLADDEDERTLSEAITEHVENSDIIIINEKESSTEKVTIVTDLLKSLNSNSHIIQNIDGNFQLGGKTRSNWKYCPFYESPMKNDEYHVVSFDMKKPIHPERFNHSINHGNWKGLMRSSGLIWFPHSKFLFSISSTGAAFQFALTDKQPGQQVIYFLFGKILDTKTILDQLNACLCTDEELHKGKFKDPWDLVDPIGEAKRIFDQILHGLTPEQQELFQEYVEEQFDGSEDEGEPEVQKVIDYLKTKCPISAEAPGEQLWYPTYGQFKGNNKQDTIHVDSFLYTDEDVDNMVEEKKFSISFCKDCGSKNTEPYNFISHSFSLEEITFIFSQLPDLKGKQILDIGSRLGAVLFSAYYMTSASHIVGVEMNEFFCDLQKDVVKKFKMGDRVEIIQADIFDQKKVFESTDIIIMHNIFEMFGDVEKNRESWVKIRALATKKGAMIVSSPSLEESLKDLGLKEPTTKGWVKNLHSNDELNIHVYVIE